MISYRRAALLGLTVPLSAIMTAVLGLWPEQEEVKQQGGGTRAQRAKHRAKKEPAQYDWATERELQRYYQVMEDDLVAAALGLIFSGALDG